MEFSRQEYWNGLPCPPPGDLPYPGIKHTSLRSPALAGSLPLAPPGKPNLVHISADILNLLPFNFTCILPQPRLIRLLSGAAHTEVAPFSESLGQSGGPVRSHQTPETVLSFLRAGGSQDKQGKGGRARQREEEMERVGAITTPAPVF